MLRQLLHVLNVGYFADTEGTVNCSPCAAGYYAANKGTVTCTKCEPGKYNTTTGNSSCATCPVNKFCTGGTDNTQCPSGYKSDAGAKVQTDCYITANKGYELRTAKSAPTTVCNKNYYNETIKNVYYGNTYFCTGCPKGTYTQGNTGSTSHSDCKACPPGDYGDTVGGGCKPCPAGYKCSGGTNKDPCSAGTYSSGGASTCSNCTANYYCPGSKDRQSCPSGYSSDSKSDSINDCYINLGPGELRVGTTGTSLVICAGGTDSINDRDSYHSDTVRAYYGVETQPCISVPVHSRANAYASDFVCDTGYEKSGSSCAPKKYTCDSGKYLAGTVCLTCTEGYRCPGGTYTYNGETKSVTVNGISVVQGTKEVTGVSLDKTYGSLKIGEKYSLNKIRGRRKEKSPARFGSRAP